MKAFIFAIASLITSASFASNVCIVEASAYSGASDSPPQTINVACSDAQSSYVVNLTANRKPTNTEKAQVLARLLDQGFKIVSQDSQGRIYTVAK